MSGILLVAPFAGWLSALAEVPDPVFADKILGDGVAIDPLEPVLRAPCDATVIAVAPTGHSVTLELANGAHLLIHIGIDTVELGGEGFAAHVIPGARVSAHDPLVTVNLDLVARRAKSLVTPIIVANEGYHIVTLALDRAVAVGDPLFEVHAEAAESTLSEVSAPNSASRTLVVPLAHGIHARPAARIAAALKPFTAEVTLRSGERTANARSTVALMTLGVGHGQAVTLTADGIDAAAAVANVIELIEGGMGEGAPASVRAQPAREDVPGAGVCAAPGVAVGPAFQFRAGEIRVERDGAGIEAETARLARARERAVADAGRGDIADAHRALIEDAELGAAALAEIARGRSAGFAWRVAVRAQAKRLRGTGDARLIERVDDLIDVERQVLRALGCAAAGPAVPEGAVLIAPVLLPSEFLALDPARIAGICTAEGGPTSHVAILAAAAGVPMVVAAGPSVLTITDGQTIILDADADADAGAIEREPDAAALSVARARVAAARARRAAHAVNAAADCRMADGTRIEVFANLGSAPEALTAVSAGAEGCGLLRTEFLFLERENAPGVEEQHAAYQAVADALQGRPLIVRTLDIGGDKPVGYLPFAREDNPALGQRGIRLGLGRPDLLRTQLQAIARVRGDVRIMLPMIVDMGEFRRVRAELDATAGAVRIPLGIMIETPAAAMLADQLAAEADFFSVGTNDLTQYALAADRGNPATAAMVDALHPAVLRLIARAAEGARAHRRPLGVCGGAASDPLAAAILIGLGVNELSATTAAIPALKATLARVRMDQCRALAASALTATSPAQVRALARAAIGPALDGAAA